MRLGRLKRVWGLWGFIYRSVILVPEGDKCPETVSATQGAGVECPDIRAQLQDFVGLVYRFNATLSSLAEADNFEDEDPIKQARYMKEKVVPVMERLREIGDELEMIVAADLWPLPSYREMLFIK